MPKQIPLDLPLATAMARDDFLVTEANRAAMAMVDEWPNWPSHGMIVIGPPGSGKTHLASIWRAASQATFQSAAGLDLETVPIAMSKGAAVIESLVAGNINEAALFHLLNLARQSGGHVLLTSESAPQDLQIHLPDLRSRLASLPFVVLGPPDDALLRAVLVKQFADRQIAVDETLISYLVKRIPRSLGMARELVTRIDEEALSEGADVNRAFASRVLSKITNIELL